jgi:mannan endo-1,4-beta-mannosidase
VRKLLKKQERKESGTDTGAHTPYRNCITFPVTGLTVTSPSSLSRTPPSSFVTRQGSRLLVDNASFKAVGPNVYWLGLDENINASISYPTPQRVLEIMATAAAMGATTIRATTLGVSVGHPLAISPSLGTFSEEALRIVDFAVYAARAYGIRLIIPLTDQWDYYHGGQSV